MLCKAKPEELCRGSKFEVAVASAASLVFAHAANPRPIHTPKTMANILGAFTMIVLLLAGFVAFKNKSAYETEIAETTARKEDLSRSQARLKKAQDELAETTATREGVDAENVKLTAEEAGQKKTNQDLQGQVESKTKLTAENKEQLDVIREKTSKVGNINELASKMRQTNAELEELAQSISASEAKLANLTSTNNDKQSQIGGMKTMFETIASGKSLPTANTSIRAIYPTWGFVTLASGNASGVVTNSTLDVVREGQVIAKLLVTAVERNSASASIIPDSIAQDVVLAVGDKVVPGQQAAAAN